MKIFLFTLSLVVASSFSASKVALAIPQKEMKVDSTSLSLIKGEKLRFEVGYRFQKMKERLLQEEQEITPVSEFQDHEAFLDSEVFKVYFWNMVVDDLVAIDSEHQRLSRRMSRIPTLNRLGLEDKISENKEVAIKKYFLNLEKTYRLIELESSQLYRIKGGSVAQISNVLNNLRILKNELIEYGKSKSLIGKVKDLEFSHLERFLNSHSQNKVLSADLSYTEGFVRYLTLSRLMNDKKVLEFLIHRPNLQLSVLNVALNVTPDAKLPPEVDVDQTVKLQLDEVADLFIEYYKSMNYSAALRMPLRNWAINHLREAGVLTGGFKVFTLLSLLEASWEIGR